MTPQHENYYKGNHKYSEFLGSQTDQAFTKYVDHVVNVSNGGTFLDVGCGTGRALAMAAARGVAAIGVDVSDTSVVAGQGRGLDLREYDGHKLPFDDETFSVVGSNNVLEHTDDPVAFLADSARLVARNGHLIVVCPNFLSVTNNYHEHTRGFVQKVRNLAMIVRKLASRTIKVEKMTPIQRDDFQPDDDACNVTNPVDIMRWARCNGFEVVHWSSQGFYSSGPVNKLDRGLARIFLGACFFVFQRQPCA